VGAKAFRFFLERFSLNFCHFLERHHQDLTLTWKTARGSACVVSRTRVSRYPCVLRGGTFTTDHRGLFSIVGLNFQPAKIRIFFFFFFFFFFLHVGLSSIRKSSSHVPAAATFQIFGVLNGLDV
jgi:hypothetical protein